MSVLEAVAFQADGKARPRAVKLPAELFDGQVNDDVMHQAVKVYLANQRQGTVMTKTRGYVSGGNQKPWRQKGTGRARQGSTRAPNWPGGGTAFGPQPREYRLDMPQKQRRLARRSALNARARENALHVIAPLSFDAPKTKRIVELLAAMGLDEQKVLVLTAEHSPNVALSARNLQNVQVLRFQEASTYDVLRADTVIVEETALGELESGAEATWTVPEKKKQKHVDARHRKAEKADKAAKATKAVKAVKAPAKKAVKKKAVKAEKKPAAKKAAAKKTTATKKKK